MRVLRAVVLLVSLVIPAAAWSAVALFTVPPGFESTEGDRSALIPFSANPATCVFGTRFQQIYMGSDIGSASIDGIWFRQDLAAATPSFFTVPDVLVTLSHTDAATGTTGGSFVENYEGGATVVFAGDLDIASPTVKVSPLPFDIEIPFQSSFQFDSTHNLLLDIQVPAGSCIQNLILDATNDCCMGVQISTDMASPTATEGENGFGLITQFAISTPPPIFNPGGYSGSWWFGPTHDGEGLLIEVVEIGGVLYLVVYWFTYDQFGNQMWLVGVAEFGFGPTVVPMERLTGPVFGPGFDPGDVVRTAMGTVIIEFFTEDTGEMSWAFIAGFGAGTYPISRLTSIFGNPGIFGPIKADALAD